MVAVLQNGAWQKSHWPAIFACEFTPPSGAPSRALFEPTPPNGVPVRALRAPGLNNAPPDANANPAVIRIVRTAAMMPVAVKQPRRLFFIIYLFQQGCKIKIRSKMNKINRTIPQPDRERGMFHVRQ
jgi:hypothetical protein